MRILIAEDDEALAQFVRQGLEGDTIRLTSSRMANRRATLLPRSSTML
jgi:DNA-binding response OmpR family regulator